jgi:hypothetical protein
MSLEQQLQALALQVRETLLAQYGTLANTCDLATEQLTQLLSHHRIESITIHGSFINENGEEGHIWLMVEDFIVDPTASQFGDYPMVIKLEDTNHYVD